LSSRLNFLSKVLITLSFASFLVCWDVWAISKFDHETSPVSSVITETWSESILLSKLPFGDVGDWTGKLYSSSSSSLPFFPKPLLAKKAMAINAIATPPIIINTTGFIPLFPPFSFEPLSLLESFAIYPIFFFFFFLKNKKN